MSEQKQFYGWKLVGVVWVIYFLNMGFGLYGGSVINAAMLKEIPMERAIFGLAYTLLNFFIGFPSLLQAACVRKWGIKGTFIIGSILILSGSIWMGFFATEPWHYLLGFGTLISTGIGFGSIICLSTTITRWFIRFRGRAMAIAYTASGFAGFIAAPLMNRVIGAANGNWRVGWMIVGSVAVVSAIVAFLFVKEYPEDLGQTPDGGEPPAGDHLSTNTFATSEEWTTGEAFRTASFWMVFIGSCSCQYPFWFFTAHWIMHLKGLGITPEIYSFAMGLFTMGSIFGRLIGGWLMDKISARYAFILGLCCYFIGSLLAIQLTKDTPIMIVYTAGILYGGAFGWSWVCLNTTTGNFFGVKSFPKLNGTILMVSAVLCSPAAIIGGKLFDLYNSYTPAFMLNIAVTSIGVIALIFAKMPQKDMHRQKLQFSNN